MLGGEDTLPLTLHLSEPVIKELELLMQHMQIDDMGLLVDRLLRESLFDEDSRRRPLRRRAAPLRLPPGLFRPAPQ